MRVLQWISSTWCELMHPAPRWPINGFRECPTCLRKTRVAWGIQFERFERCLLTTQDATVTISASSPVQGRIWIISVL